MILDPVCVPSALQRNRALNARNRALAERERPGWRNAKPRGKPQWARHGHREKQYSSFFVPMKHAAANILEFALARGTSQPLIAASALVGAVGSFGDVDGIKLGLNCRLVDHRPHARDFRAAEFIKHILGE